MKMPVVMDCDPGIDDAVALFVLLASDRISLLGMTACAGNQVLEKTYENARNLLTLAGREDIPVFRGAAGPLMRELVTAGDIHGDTGLGTVRLPDSAAEHRRGKAWDFIARTLEQSQEPVTILATGPLTNIAVLLLSCPELKPKIREITLMGGACFGGNITPQAEFNIYVDPEAAQIVFRSGVPIRMFGLDVTSKAQMYEEEFGLLAEYQTKAADVFYRILKFYHQSSAPSMLTPQDGRVGVRLHDPSAAAYLIDPTLFTLRDCFVEIETKDGPTLGSTVVDYDRQTGKPFNASVAFGVDRERLVKLVLDSIRKF